MTNRSRTSIRVAVVLLSIATPVAAQSGGGHPIEIGADAAFRHRSTNVGNGNSDNQTGIELPSAQLRVGFGFNDMIELEPALGFSYRDIGGDHTTMTNFDLGLPINLDKDRTRANLYLRPLIGLLRYTSTLSNGASGSASQISYGGGLGVRLPIERQFAARLEANYRHGNKHDGIRAFDQYALLAGFSFFTR